MHLANLELVDYLLQKKCNTVKQAAAESKIPQGNSNYEEFIGNFSLCPLYPSIESIESCLEKGTALLSTNQMAKYGVVTEAFLKTNLDLMNRSFDVNYSGSTAVTVLLTGNRLICANVGDSRAVMASYKSAESLQGLALSEEFLRLHKDQKLWVAIPLSRDHKPDDSLEYKRIMANNGRIEPFRGMCIHIYIYILCV